MFHGTWGYIHHPNPTLLKSLDHSQLTLQAYYNALQKVPLMKISLDMFLPTPEEEVHWEAVAKSKLACVMNKYVGSAAHPTLAIPSKPPPVEEIDCSAPNIEMLKLMSASDNLAKGAGQIIEAILLQSGLKPKDFMARVQIMDGDLGTCKNFNSQRALRTPT
ncbi:hypothetical protein PCANC_01915 [Puccinia coronata f. sp. avenae]|uniref:DUF6589 domain-containing protein n=1 Tax=Puccinia coronata f. sp. avenae TaxID=200324 RepID=A0A2N5W4A1_9BASI|nr:hypothetical protein PCANC_01915 [Puccinia coronata f. sp. avenae]